MIDNSAIQEKLHELHSLEQNLQMATIQSQSIQVELNEITNALSELKNTEDEVYKIVEGIMIKVKKENTIKELEEKKKMLEVKSSSFQKQEKSIQDRAQNLRREISSSGKK